MNKNIQFATLTLASLFMASLSGCNNEEPKQNHNIQTTNIASTTKDINSPEPIESPELTKSNELIESSQPIESMASTENIIVSAAKAVATPDANKEKSTELFFTEKFESDNSKRTDNFDCHQKMYAVLKMINHERGIHQIDVEWIDPYDKTRERTSTQIYINADTEFSWSALSLSAATGANLIAWANPAAGMEDFLGEWTIKVFLDKKLAIEKNLSVSC